ncbi:hypothetical protein [Paenibacillus sp. P36]|uniref:hypothetical protein n=1 Tax=Paenibacillus sp. P36 TaxID=3342538 RepID=UPI0038B3BB9B
MIGLLGTFIAFSVVGFVILRYLRLQAREVWAFVIITCIGFVLWVSIIMHHPLDLNKAIAWMIDSLQLNL